MRLSNWNEHVVLITGGTGSFGRKFVELALHEKNPKKIVVFSRDEHKQHDMAQGLAENGYEVNERVRFFVGDVRDRDRLYRAFDGVDVVVHAAALKHVPSCEYNPFEAVQTNINGAKNVIDAAIDNNVKKVLGVSTDKAVNPVNLYGATKLVAEKLFIQGNAYSGAKPTRVSCVRYGNVVGSRGSVVPLFKRQRQTGQITVTDLRMTRFWISLEQGVRFVMKSIDLMHGGEIFVPKLPSMQISVLINVLAPDCPKNIIGIRPGEKLHEVLISRDEARHAVELKDMYVISPSNPWAVSNSPEFQDGKILVDDFCYSSDSNKEWLTAEMFRDLLGGDA